MNPDAEPSGRAVRLSRCNLWNGQRRFYEENGVEAWNHRVPFQATSNPVLADAYAQVILRFLQDHAATAAADAPPVHLLELGSGPGAFGFRVVRKLLELRQTLALDEAHFVYVMSDLADKNVSFWRSHPALRSLVEQGVLDFARFDIGSDRRVHLLESGRVLEPGAECGASPLVVMANYVLDTLPQDLFRVKDGRLLEVLTRGLPEGAALPVAHNEPLSLHQLGPVELSEARMPCYDDPVLDEILAGYAESLPDQGFLFPVQALAGLGHLLAISGGSLLLLATDKGDGLQPPSVPADGPHIVLHDASFSMSVSFHTLGEYFRRQGGCAIHQSALQAVNTSVFLVGRDLEELPETKTAVAAFLHRLSPGELNALLAEILPVAAGLSAETLTAVLGLAQWDSWMVSRLMGPLLACARSASPRLRDTLAEGMRRCAEQHYWMPGAESPCAQAGLVFQELRDFPAALGYYERSIEGFGEQPAGLYANTRYNMGLCHFYLGDHDRALEAFQDADRAAPHDDMMAKGWIYHLTEGAREPRDLSSGPVAPRPLGGSRN